MEAAEANIGVMKAMFLVTYIFSLFPTGMDFRYFMWYLRSLQLLVHLPMFHVLVPANVSRYLEVVKPVVVFDYLPSEWLSHKLYTFDMEKQR